MTTVSRRVTLKALENVNDGDFVWDTELRGFGVRGRGTGLYYVLKTRVNGQQRWFTIGKHGSPWTPDTARRKVLTLMGEIADGQDPAEVRDDLKKRITMAQLCEIYLQEGCSEKKPTTLATDKGRIERHILPLLGRKDVRALTRKDIEQFMRDVAEGKTATNVKTGKRGRAVVEGGRGAATRTVGLLGGILTFALNRGIIAVNPVRGVKRFKDRRVERFLSEAELGRLGQAVAVLERENKITTFAAAAVRLLLLTGARRGEILSLRWDWIDFERSLAFLPDSKTGQKQLYLSAPALAVLSQLPRLSGNQYVICGDTPGQHLTDLKRPWTRILKGAEIEKLRVHDLRHNFASVGAMGGLSLPMIGKLLGHLRAETTARYSHLADDPVRAANERIGSRISMGLSGVDSAPEAKSSSKV